MNINNLKFTFLKELFRRGYTRRAVRKIARNTQPFFDYLARVNTHGMSGIEPEHIQAYIALLKETCTALANDKDILLTNEKIFTIKMFSLQMFIAGKLPRDYAADAGFLPFTKGGTA